VKTPTWDEVRQFLNFDAWTPDKPRSTDHDYFEKTLTTGEVLITKVSRSAGKTMSPGRFKAILSDQLRVNERQFWDVIRLRQPAERPAPDPEPEPVSLPLWLVQQLRAEGIPDSELEGVDQEAATALLAEARARPRR
jgi:hypothetical protein